MALSQCLDDSPARWPLKRNDLNLQELYNERHRLALEELVSGGVDNFLDFLRKERIANFLSDDEMRRIAHAAVIPRCWSTHGDELTADQSMTSSMDCSSVTYFPEVSDVEPPLLEIGWPAFTTGSFRGVTRAVAYFQPSYGECIYSCKEAARRMIKSAKEVIALVTDSLTDLDIFKDLQEASTLRKVPVYILLDQSSAPAFLKMCSQVKVRLEELQHMRVRTITGGTYFMRSGAKITGKVHERFMLIDGNRVATGSYRFNWTDGKLNSSNLIELSGQITESFDEEFRILYAQSVPINTHGPPSARNSGIFGHLLVKHPAASSPQSARDRPAEGMCLASTPNRKPKIPDPEGQQLPGEPPTAEAGQVGRSLSESSTIGEDVAGEGEEILAGIGVTWSPHGAPAGTESVSVATQTTCGPTAEAETQTDLENFPQPGPRHTTTEHVSSAAAVAASSIPAATAGDRPAASSSSSGSGSSRQRSPHHRPASHHGPAALENNLRDCFRKLTKERQYHYSTIRNKLEHMVSVLAQRRELVDITNMTAGPGTHRGPKAQRECGQGQSPSLLVENVGVGTWPRARCLH